jgi:catalase (peroxidase I)
MTVLVGGLRVLGADYRQTETLACSLAVPVH